MKAQLNNKPTEKGNWKFYFKEGCSISVYGQKKKDAIHYMMGSLLKGIPFHVVPIVSKSDART